MGETTKIEWCEHTFNPWWGCEKISEGCARCYAESFSKRVGFKIWGQDADRRFFGDKRWQEPLKWNRAAEKAGFMRRVFCGSMCDIFEDRMDLDEHRLRVFRMVPETPHLLWLFLTKRPLRALQMLPREWKGNGKWPRNVMVGVTIENQARLNERMPLVKLLHEQYPGVQVFASCEPLLSALEWEHENSSWLEYLDWVVAGGESGHGARPCHPDWAKKLLHDCQYRTDMGRPWPLSFLWKQWGDWQNGSNFADSRQDRTVLNDGRVLHMVEDTPDNDTLNRWSDFSPHMMARVGKKDAGRLLYGQEWNGAPMLSHGPQVEQ